MMKEGMEMAEYIDKAALLKSFEETIKKAEIWRDDCSDLGIPTASADRAIIDFNESRLRVQNFPTVDAVKVVRCKECEYFRGSKEVYNCMFHLSKVVANGFCAWAKRRKDG